MQGIWLFALEGARRPKTKLEIKRMLAENPRRVRLEATSLHGNEYAGPITDAPNGTYYFVGPDPHTKRMFYGQLIKDGSTIKLR